MNSIDKDPSLRVDKTWGGGLFSKNRPDLEIINKQAQCYRGVELKAYRRSDLWSVPSFLPKTLTGGQKARLEAITRDDGGDHVGGLLVTEYVCEESGTNTLVAIVPHRWMWQGIPPSIINFSAGPVRIYPPHGLLVWTYKPTVASGKEFDNYRWILYAPWWHESNYMNAIRIQA